jgi:hypothetical protein
MSSKSKDAVQNQKSAVETFAIASVLTVYCFNYESNELDAV